MCGITGIVSYDKPIGKNNLPKMLSQIRHRGPDQRGMYIKPHVSMGIQRLSIIDLFSGNQPIENEDGSVAVIFNGEIYNYRELTKDLIKKGHIFKTKSDTEVLVHLYETLGEEMSKYLNGMFTFSIWDKKKKKIFISRDPAGIKPLYFYHKGSFLIFGSELKAITSNADVTKEININSLNYYSFLGYIPGDLSIFKNIYKLPAGHNLIFSRSGIKIVNYYTVNSNNFSSEKDIDKILESAVLSQSMADVPLGVLLSGGIDSSLVAYYLTKKIGRRIKTFSISFDDKSFDESVYSTTVSKLLKTNHFQENFNSKDVLNLFPQIIEKMDEPLADPSLLPTYKLCALARKQVKVALSGDGGDELFGGYPTYQGHIIAEKFGNLVPKGLIKSSLWLTSLSKASFENYPFSETVGRFLSGFGKSNLHRHLIWMSVNNLEDILKKDKQRSHNIFKEKLFREYAKNINSISNNSLIKYQLLDFYTYLIDNLLVKVDRASMFNSLEVRVPFLDLNVISYAFNISINHVTLFETKRILRTLLKKHLPSSIVERRKKGFGIPLSKWILGDLRSIVFEHLQNKNLYNYFDKEKVLTLWRNHESLKQNNAKIIWMVVMFSAWLNKWYRQI